MKKFKKNMEEKGVLFTYRLPTFSPDLNPIEKLWRNTKKDTTHLKYFKAFDELRLSVINAFRKYMERCGKGHQSDEKTQRFRDSKFPHR